MDTNVNAGILAMRAANARRAEICDASVRADKPGGGGDRPAKARKASSTMPARVWNVTLVIEHEGKRSAWTCADVSAPTIKRAIKGARERRRTLGKPGSVVAVGGVLDRDYAKLDAEQI